LVLAAIDQLDSRACDKVLHRIRHEHFARPCQPSDTGSSVNGDSGDLLADKLALACM
jgi:hypothetical protein